ncbi:MAG: hypothetical protein POELPBGB_02813 [Bacteroidia bacterium]|nr:hypothetical protein [Bacteroidia bacterium]
MSENILDAEQKVPAKNKTIRIERIIIVIGIIGALFKIQHWPGANIMIALSLITLAIIYFPLGFYFLGNNSEKMVAVVSGLFLSLIPVSILFKHLHWPGAFALVVAAVVTSPLVLATLLYLRRNAAAATMSFYNSMILRTALLILLMIFMALLRMH